MTSPASRPAGAPVAVSGVGVVSPLGNDLAAFDGALFAGRSGLRVQSLDLPGIDLPPVVVAPAAFDASTVVAPSRVPLDRGTAMALAAAEAAARAARLDERAEHERLGVFWGSGMAGAATFEATCRTVYAGRRRMRPTSVVTTMPNAPVAELALRFGARGAALAYACACASAAVAIGEAMRAIRAGWIDVAIAGGSESMLTPGVLASWQAMRVLAPVPAGGDVSAVCRPFAADRNGFALGEAAAAFVLEAPAAARERGARPRLALTGYATNCDGVHITNPDAAGQTRAMRAALADAGLDAAAIGYVNAHGTATLAGDAAEATSLATVFGAAGVPVSSTKAIHGHLLGAGGAVELLATLRALDAGRLPPTAGTSAVDPAFALDLVLGEARPAPALAHAMSNSFAFGGTNAVLIASRLDA
ncbi:beta-ketoacyl-[acyl-carrier-protein] synthase family protein [Piscinibacter koreensis]|uniref:Nodulation protein E n=1 Tax=Piscinibacter koreensis TaxID=2742824 RepID=A0A7Y6NLM1_9BURK|nr:beta-ketoacyl-[acyl-carrier-protein] synthase family protein [Schlegelella koreensis]NUZ05473.1 beta-ketoacyl-[acyl-carrier-protein] synthase family protein [Schlegelella koreensis]